MYRESKLKCPYLEGHSDGVRCCVQNEFIRNMEEVDVKLCLSRHYEVCHVYYLELQSAVSGMSLNAA